MGRLSGSCASAARASPGARHPCPRQIGRAVDDHDLISEYEERLDEGNDVILRARRELSRARTLCVNAKDLCTTLTRARSTDSRAASSGVAVSAQASPQRATVRQVGCSVTRTT